MFITRQLKGLEDTKSAQFNRYFYLLEVQASFFIPVQSVYIELFAVYPEAKVVVLNLRPATEI